MKKSKSSKSLDRLSELPDSLIFHIFWYLPMREVVRTSILSSHWKNLWKTAPCLNFDDFGVDNFDTDRVRKFIDWALMVWRGIKILKFKIDFGSQLNKSLCSDIDLWVRFAKEYGVEELHIDLGYVDDILHEDTRTQEELYWALQCVYSCSSLKKLYLKGCEPHIPINNVVNWNQLESLTIDGYELSEDLISQVLSGCPRLEILKLYLSENHENLSIESSSLKHLLIEKYLYYEDDQPSEVTKLRISTPNLEKLEILGVPYSKFLMNSVPSLTHANLSFCGLSHYVHHSFVGTDFVDKTLSQILLAIQNVEELILSDWCIKALGDMKDKTMLPPFLNVEWLQLNGCFQEYEEIVCLLKFFPKLETLVLQNDKAESLEVESNLPDSFLQEPGRIRVNWVEANLHNSFLQELRRIRVTCDEGEDSIFLLIEILLKHASKLEKMVFRIEGAASPSNSLLLQLASEKVTRMPRSSQIVEFIFL